MSESPYFVSARKYRPANFKSVMGQKNLTATLKNAIDSGRLAQAYLFCGPRGVGKTSCARIFAKTINCLDPTPDGEACGLCESCRSIEDGTSFNIIELDAASNNSVDDIRALTEQVNVPPVIGKYRIFIIDEVHMLSSQAFNAFLKTLEEPPSYVVFILATTEKHKVIPTILSRCQIYDFKRITIQDMVEHLQYVASSEGISAEVSALNVIAKKADGAMRDALSIFDQVAASSFGNITYESAIAALNVLDYDFYFRLVDAFRQGDVATSLLIYKEIRDRGFDSLFFVNGLANHIRDLMVAYSPKTAELLEIAKDLAGQYSAQAKSLPIDWHYAAMKLLNDCDFKYRTSSNKQFIVELTLIKLCQLLNPPTPPFDHVECDEIPLRDPASPLNNPVEINSTAQVAPSKEKPLNSKHEETPEKNEIPRSEPDSASDRVENTKAPAPRRRSRSTKLPETFKLSSESEITEISQSDKKKQEPITIQGIRDAWEEYISLNPDKYILVSSMTSSLPQKVSDEEFKVIVEHPAVRQAFESEMGDLVNFLRAKLRNDSFILKVEIDDSKEIIKQIPPQELLKEMVDKNPVLADFISAIDAELI